MSCCILRGKHIAMLRRKLLCLLESILTFSARPAKPPSHQSSLKSVRSSRCLSSAVFWPKLRLAGGATAYCGAGPEHRLPAPGLLPSKLSPPAGSTQPCLLRAQRARRAPPSELLQRGVKQKAAAAASPESNTRCCRPAAAAPAPALTLYCTLLFSPAPAPIVSSTAINKTMPWRSGFIFGESGA